jgi:hypothetical protein
MAGILGDVCQEMGMIPNIDFTTPVKVIGGS